MAERGGDPTILAGARRSRQPAGRFPFVPPGGPLGAFPAMVDAFSARLAATFEREMEAGRGFLWLPVAFGTGVLAYFALPREPWAPALVALTLTLVVAAWRQRLRVGPFRLLVIAAAVSAGALSATLRTDRVAAPAIEREMTVTAVGWIAALGEGPRGGVRVRLRIQSIDEIAPEERPRTVRITVRTATEDLAVGDAIGVRARLTPPSGPVLPGGYDFARSAFYDRLGAYGFAYGAARPAAIGPPPLAIRSGLPLANLRQAIRRRIEAALPGDAGHLAAALIVGERGGISEATQTAMRSSGLGHILAISGLHMALVAGTAFWLVRALLALSSGLALNRPIKKWAAAAALAVATVYLGLSGAGIATQRAYVMMAIMLVAVMIDRRAITLRNVALAALVILLTAPESLLTASFHMSFAATVALIAAYEAITERLDGQPTLIPGSRGIARWVGSYAARLSLTSVIAGLATAPFAAFHFQRIAPLTLIANLAAMPAVGLVVMPMALVAVLLMPFGLEGPALAVMHWGLAWVVTVAEKTAEWSADYGRIAAAPRAALLLLVAGFLWLALWRERWRLAGLAPIALALPIAFLATPPDVIVAADGTAAAVRGADGRLKIVGGKGADFEVAYWLRADADPREPGADDLAAGVTCDRLGCVTELGGRGEKLALVNAGTAFSEDCRLAAIVISRLNAPPNCAAEAIVIARAELDRFGAHALYRQEEPPGYRTRTAYPESRRPFMRQRRD